MKAPEDAPDLGRASDEAGARMERRASWILLGVFWLMPVLFIVVSSKGLYWRDHAGFFRATWWSIYDQVRTGIFPVLNVWHPSGIPHEMSTNHALYTPMSLLLFLGPFERTYDLFVLSHFPLLATGVYVFGRQAGARPIAALGAGVVAALAGPVVAFENLVVGLQGMAYTPWLLAAVLHARRQPGLVATGLVALTLGFAAQAVMPEIILIDVVATGWILLSPRFEPLRFRALVSMAAGAALGTMASLVDVVPLLEAMRGSERWVGFTDETRQAWSVTHAQLLDLVVPGLWSLPELSCLVIPDAVGSEEPPYLATLYLGSAIPVGLAALSTRDRRTLPLFIALIAFILVAMGPLSPLHGWLSSLPLLRSARYPVKYMMVVAACLSALVALLLSRLGERRQALLVWSTLYALVASLLAVAFYSEAFEAWYRASAQPFKEQAVFEFFRDTDVPALALEHLRVRVWWSVLAAVMLFGACAGLRRGSQRAQGLVVVVVVFFDLVGAARYGVATAPTEAERLAPAVARALQVRPQRVFSGAVPPIPELPGRSPFESAMISNGSRGHLAWHTLRAFAALDLEGLGVNRVQSIVQEALDTLDDQQVLRVFARAGIARYFADRVADVTPVAEAVDPAGRPIYILDIPDVRPYLAVYPKWVHGDATSTTAIDLLSGRLDEHAAVLWNRPSIASGSASSDCEARVVNSPQRPARDIEFGIEASCGSLVVLQEIRLPRWRVEIDGAPADTLEAEVGYIAAAVPAGQHHVRIYYDSLALRWLPWSLGAFSAALLLVVVSGLLTLRRTRTKTSTVDVS